MVFAVMLTHGRYSSEQLDLPDVMVPYNIRLILYTHPTKTLNAIEVDYILRQLLDITSSEGSRNYTFTLKSEVLNTENIPYTLISPPHMTRIAKTNPYPNDKRIIGEKYEPQGIFKIYEPNTTTPNIEIEFKDDVGNFSRSEYAEPKMVRQTRIGSENVKIYYKKKSIEKSIGEFLKELSCFYETEFPGKIVDVLQLSCRSDRRIAYSSMDELSDDLAHRWSMKEYEEGTPDFRPGLEGIKPRNKSENLYKSPDFKFEFKNPPVIIKKSEDVEIPNPSVCSSARGGQKIYKRRTTKKKKFTKKYKKQKQNKKINTKNTKKYKTKYTKKYKNYKY
jgi:hypothetical protein